MPNIARVGDTVTAVCTAHEHPMSVTGQIVDGEATVIINGMACATVGSRVVFSCGHIGTIVSGLPNIIIGGRMAATIGSTVTGPMIGQVISASANVLT